MKSFDTPLPMRFLSLRLEMVLAQSFASMARWDGVGEAWVQMKSRGLKKAPAWSIIEMHGVFTPFFMQHSSHPEYETIAYTLRNLTNGMKRLVLASECEDTYY